ASRLDLVSSLEIEVVRFGETTGGPLRVQLGQAPKEPGLALLEHGTPLGVLVCGHTRLRLAPRPSRRAYRTGAGQDRIKHYRRSSENEQDDQYLNQVALAPAASPVPAVPS